MALLINNLDVGCQASAGFIALQVIELVKDSDWILAAHGVSDRWQDLDAFVDEWVGFIKQPGLHVLDEIRQLRHFLAHHQTAGCQSGRHGRHGQSLLRGSDLPLFVGDGQFQLVLARAQLDVVTVGDVGIAKELLALLFHSQVQRFAEAGCDAAILGVSHAHHVHGVHHQSALLFQLDGPALDAS